VHPNAANIDPLTPETLAQLALASARSTKVILGTDGISYLIAAKRYGIVTPLSRAYEEKIKRRSGAANLEVAREMARLATASTSIADNFKR
jgi:hypothetical protein